MPEGQVRDITTGEHVADTPDLEATFLAAVEVAAAKEPVYVVVGLGSPDGFDDRIRALGVPIIRDSSFGDAALIVAGDPDEWEAESEQVGEELALLRRPTELERQRKIGSPD